MIESMVEGRVYSVDLKRVRGASVNYTGRYGGRGIAPHIKVDSIKITPDTTPVFIDVELVAHVEEVG